MKLAIATVPPTQDTETEARDKLFFAESSNRLDSVNSKGCYGLGQDCNNVLSTACPNWKVDRECQLEFWTAYMARRYGTWQAAKAHWDAQVPIGGVDVGNWW